MKKRKKFVQLPIDFDKHCDHGLHADPVTRFWRFVDRRNIDGCWRWTGGVQSAGYGTLQVDGVTVLAHRFSYELHIGPIAPGLVARHTCDHPWCVSPFHITPGTVLENQRDKAERGRARNQYTKRREA